MKATAKKWGIGILVTIVLLRLPALLNYNPYYLHHFTIIFLFSIVVLGYWLIHRTGQVSFAQAGFMMIGAYTTAALQIHLGFNFWFALPLGGVTAGFIALLVGIPTLKLRGAYFFLITFALCEIIRLFYMNAFLEIFGGVEGIREIPGPGKIEIPYLFTLDFTRTMEGYTSYYYLMLFFFAISMLIMWQLDRTRLGKLIVGVRDAEDLSEAIGVPTMAYRVFAFVLAAFITGIAGGLYAAFNTFVDPLSFMIVHSIEYLSFLIIGGPTSVWGPLLGTAVAETFGEMGRGLGLGEFILTGFLMILVVLFFPPGVVGIPKALKRFIDRRRGIIVEEEDAGATTAS
jgi:branched-chain amino acid transport system permease protein